jgi:hypothetical protein
VNAQLAEFPAASLTLQVTVVVPFGKVAPDAGEHEEVPIVGQLSLAAGAAYVTGAEHWPGVFATVMLDGQVIEGGCVSVTVTVNEQLTELPAASTTPQPTVVEPLGKVEPEGGVHTGVPAPEQLSDAVAVKFTIAEHWPGAFPCVIGAGQLITGFWVSLIVTVKLQLRPEPVVQVTVVVPAGKVEPAAGVHVTVPQAPVVTGAA